MVAICSNTGNKKCFAYFTRHQHGTTEKFKLNGIELKSKYIAAEEV